MYAKITKDHLYEVEVLGERSDESRAGWLLWHLDEPTEVKLIECKLYDDDGELYYEALADDDALESLFDWAQRDAGVTLLKTFNEDKGEWEDCIG